MLVKSVLIYRMVRGFCVYHHIYTGYGTHIAFSPVDMRAVSSGAKWLLHEVDHSPPSSAEVKNVWSYTLTLPYVFIAMRLVKHRDFTSNLHLMLVCQCHTCSRGEYDGNRK